MNNKEQLAVCASLMAFDLALFGLVADVMCPFWIQRSPPLPSSKGDTGCLWCFEGEQEFFSCRLGEISQLVNEISQL